MFFKKIISKKVLGEIIILLTINSLLLNNLIVDYLDSSSSFGNFRFFDTPFIPILYLCSWIFIIYFVKKIKLDYKPGIILILLFLIIPVFCSVLYLFLINFLPELAYIPFYPLILLNLR